MRIYTADDEEPDCGRCDRVCSSDSCCDECGPEYGWNNYQRIVNEPSKEEIAMQFDNYLKRKYL